VPPVEQDDMGNKPGKATRELGKKGKSWPKASEVLTLTVKDLDSVEKPQVLDSLTGGRPPPPRNRRRPTHVRGAARQSEPIKVVGGVDVEGKEEGGGPHRATYTGAVPQSVKDAQADSRERSQSLGPPVPDARSKPKGPEVPDKGKKPRKIGFLTPSFDTSVAKETTVVALPSVEEDLEGERTPSSKSASNDQTDSGKDVVNVKEDSKEPKDDTKEVTSISEEVLEDDKEKTTTKEVSINASESEKPLPLAFDAPPAIEFKQVEKSHSEDNNGPEKCGQDEKEEHVPGNRSSKVEEAQEKWNDVIEVALKANTEEQEEEKKHEQNQVQEQMQEKEQEQKQKQMQEKEQKDEQNPEQRQVHEKGQEQRQVQEEEQVKLLEQEEEAETEMKKDILSKPQSENDVVDQVPGEEDNNHVILKEVKKEENDESDKSGTATTSTSEETSTKVQEEEEADILEVKVEENEKEVQSTVAPASICCEKERPEESYGESSIASSLGEEKVEKVDDAKIVTIGGGESEVGGIVEKCEVNDLKTEPIAKE